MTVDLESFIPESDQHEQIESVSWGTLPSQKNIPKKAGVIWLANSYQSSTTSCRVMCEEHNHTKR